MIETGKARLLMVLCIAGWCHGQLPQANCNAGELGCAPAGTESGDWSVHWVGGVLTSGNFRDVDAVPCDGKCCDLDAALRQIATYDSERRSLCFVFFPQSVGMQREAAADPETAVEHVGGGMRQDIISWMQRFIEQGEIILVLSALGTPLASHMVHNTLEVSVDEVAKLESSGLPVAAMGTMLELDLDCDYRGGQVMHRDGAFNYDFDMERATKNLSSELIMFVEAFLKGALVDDPAALLSPAAQVVVDVLTIGEEELVVNSMSEIQVEETHGP